MANQDQLRASDRAASVQRLFNSIAPRYDLINDIQSLGLHRLWKRRLLTMADPRPGERALDLCCGTGDIARALASRGAQVAALDFSQPMLEVARRRGPREIPHPILYVQADALRAPFPDGAFDLVTMGYGLRNLASFEDGVREMLRVTRPGGRILILDFGKPEWRPWRTLYFAYLRFVVPIFGLCFCGNARAYAYILDSLQRYPAQEGVSAQLRLHRAENLQCVRFLGGVMTLHYAKKPAAGANPKSAIATPAARDPSRASSHLP